MKFLLEGEDRDLLDLVSAIASEKLEPAASAGESAALFPRELISLLGESGLLSLPFPEEFGGANRSYRTYLSVIEELSRAWLTVGMSVSVHTLTASPVLWYGNDEQRARWLPFMLNGKTLGAYCLSEPEYGSDAAHLATTARQDGNDFVLNGRKAWITHGPIADYFTVFARTGGEGAKGISLFMTKPAATIAAEAPEKKMGMAASPTAQVVFNSHLISGQDLIGELGSGFAIAMQALDAGRLGIAACAVGLAQRALDLAVNYAKERQQFGRAIGTFQGLRWTIAEMQAAVHSARAAYLVAADFKDHDQPYSALAASAKMVATDAAMRVTNDAIQIFGGNGYVSDYDVERLFREAKVLQIVEGTNQIQREIIGKSLLG